MTVKAYAVPVYYRGVQLGPLWHAGQRVQLGPSWPLVTPLTLAARGGGLKAILCVQCLSVVARAVVTSHPSPLFSHHELG